MNSPNFFNQPNQMPGQQTPISPGPVTISGASRCRSIIKYLLLILAGIIVLSFLIYSFWRLGELCHQALKAFFDFLERAISGSFRTFGHHSRSSGPAGDLASLAMILIAVLGAIKLLRRKK